MVQSAVTAVTDDGSKCNEVPVKFFSHWSNRVTSDHGRRVGHLLGVEALNPAVASAQTALSQ